MGSTPIHVWTKFGGRGCGGCGAVEIGMAVMPRFGCSCVGVLGYKFPYCG